MGTIWHGYKLGDDSRNRHVAKEKEITATEFNAITPENCMKPMFVQPKEGVFTFAESDEMIDFAEANNLLLWAIPYMKNRPRLVFSMIKVVKSRGIN